MTTARTTHTAIERAGKGAIIRITREKVSDLESQAIEPEVLAAGPGAGWRLALDLSEVSLLTSAGLGMLVTVHKACRAGGGRLVVFGLADEIVSLLKITRLDSLFKAVPDRARALEALA